MSNVDQPPSLIMCSMSIPPRCKLEAKVRLNVCGLHLRPVFFSSLLSIDTMPHGFICQTLLPEPLLGIHCLSRLAVLLLKGAFLCLLPLPQMVTVQLSQSMASALMLASSLNHMPLSANRLTMHLSHMLSAILIRYSTC